MPSVHSKNLEIYNAKQFKKTVANTTSSNLYLTIGKTLPWPVETTPPTPTTNTEDTYQIWKYMIGGKKITGNDVIHCAPRFNWTAGRVYSEYDDKIDSKVLKTPNNAFYVVTDDFNVYKCISNNYGGLSIVKPTQTPVDSIFQTDDKYVWKYMYTISAEDQLRFTTSQFIPVKTLAIQDGSTQWSVQNNAVSGAIHSIKLLNPGAGYNTSNISVRITGDGTGANAFVIRDTANNKIKEVVIDDEGRGYTRAQVIFVGGGGRGASARAILSPPGGHGSDPITELGASYIMISVQIKGTESGVITTANDFRQVAIIEDPLVRGTTNAFSGLTFSQVTTAIVSGISVNYRKDETVWQGSSLTYSTFRGSVADWDPGTNQLRLTGVEGSPQNDLLFGYDSGATRTLVSVSVNPALEIGTGQLLYIDNIQPIQRDSSQTEDFKIVLSF